MVYIYLMLICLALICDFDLVFTYTYVRNSAMYKKHHFKLLYLSIFLNLFLIASWRGFAKAKHAANIKLLLIAL
jgi:hypothetical protein